MRKQIYLILLIGMMATTLSACGKNTDTNDVKKIEVGDISESKEPTERKYEDTNKEPVTAPDRNSKQEVDSDNTPNEEENTIIERDPTIYGIWSATDGSSITIYNSPTGIQFSMYDTQLESNVYGELETDNNSYIQMTYTKPVEKEVVTGEIPTDTETDDTSVEYATYEEMMAALEQVEKEQQETVRYEINTLEFIAETQQMHMILTNTNRTLDLTMYIDENTPDYSLENNEISEDTAIGIVSETVETVEE